MINIMMFSCENIMIVININIKTIVSRFTYLLTYLLTALSVTGGFMTAVDTTLCYFRLG